MWFVCYSDIISVILIERAKGLQLFLIMKKHKCWFDPMSVA